MLVIIGLVSCNRDAVPGDMFNQIDGTHIGYQMFFGQAPVLDETDQGYADLFISFDLDGGVTLTFLNLIGGADPNSGGELYYPSQSYYGEYWKVDDLWHIQFGNYDTLYVTKNRKFALDWTNGDWSFSEGGGPSTDDRPCFTLQALSGENIGSRWTLILYEKIGWLNARTGEGMPAPPNTIYGPPVKE